MLFLTNDMTNKIYPYSMNTPSKCRHLSKTDCLPPECSFTNGVKRQFCRKSKNKTMKKHPPSSKSPISLSKCQHLSKTDCLPPECSFTNGVKRQFCRKSKNKMSTVKTKKERIQEMPTKKDTMKIRNAAAKKIATFMKNISTKKKAIATNKKAVATSKIGKFMISKRANITSHFLGAVCPSSGVCIAFGKETNKIKEFFNNFVDSQYRESAKKLAEGSNGIIFEYEYQRLKYKTYTVVKMSKSDDTDSLMYEFFAGMAINKVYKKFPCFLETYGINTNPINLYKSIIFDHISPNQLQDSKITNLITASCQTPRNVAVQIEHIHNPETLENAMKKYTFWEIDLLPVLFQLYYTMNQLQNDFTHYDLHASNVLLYEPIKGKYIYFHFQLDDGKLIFFKSRYIAKIIDYGRIYFNDVTNPTYNSDYIFNKLCAVAECNTAGYPCGQKKGYEWLYKGNNVKYRHYINSRKTNKSHDLRLLKIIEKIYKSNASSINLFSSTKYNGIRSDIQLLFSKIVYTELYGTKEKIKSGLPSNINNIMDAFAVLQRICSNVDFILSNTTEYASKDKIGDLYIYTNKDMKFIPHK